MKILLSKSEQITFTNGNRLNIIKEYFPNSCMLYGDDDMQLKLHIYKTYPELHLEEKYNEILYDMLTNRILWSLFIENQEEWNIYIYTYTNTDFEWVNCHHKDFFIGMVEHPDCLNYIISDSYDDAKKFEMLNTFLYDLFPKYRKLNDSKYFLQDIIEIIKNKDNL